MKRALIAMSGGVDSSMTALLMQQAGYDCVGAHMQLMAEESADAAGARDIAARLGIPFHTFDLSQRFHDTVVQPFVEGYEAGETPNPCIDCNRSLKFGALLDIADELGCHYLATGHYAQIEHDDALDRYVARTAVDDSKDQSYVLYTLSQEQLSRIVLPLGIYHKSEIRQMAEKAGFPNAQKGDSQDICFIPDNDYTGFIDTYRGRSSQSGNMLDIGGNIVGQHKGLIHYTIGQRKGLGAHGRPVFVQSISAEDNSITIGDDESKLLTQSFLVRDYNWTTPPESEDKPLSCTIKVGYKHKQKPGTVEAVEVGGISYLKVSYQEPQRAISPGQAAVFYDGTSTKDGDTVLGGGTIHKALHLRGSHSG
ncbi:MAG: tRNA 2-thiouridine(34) synthase MnmA [Coriobacteriia bacterium]|nr:tRNA 2-thiouridine(34) synthase MnmA [Coriobacteriia bacterium]